MPRTNETPGRPLEFPWKKGSNSDHIFRVKSDPAVNKSSRDAIVPGQPQRSGKSGKQWFPEVTHKPLLSIAILEMVSDFSLAGFGSYGNLVTWAARPGLCCGMICQDLDTDSCEGR